MRIIRLGDVMKGKFASIEEDAVRNNFSSFFQLENVHVLEISPHFTMRTRMTLLAPEISCNGCFLRYPVNRLGYLIMIYIYLYG